MDKKNFLEELKTKNLANIYDFSRSFIKDYREKFNFP